VETPQMASHPRSIHHLYDRYRSNPSMETGNTRGAFNKPDIQDPQNKHDTGYSNDVPANSWLRSDGTRKPSFDRDNSWRKGREASLDWGSGSELAVIRSPGKNTPDR
jgi:hypothetical protein